MHFYAAGMLCHARRTNLSLVHIQLTTRQHGRLFDVDAASCHSRALVWYSCVHDGWSVHRRGLDGFRPLALHAVPSGWCWVCTLLSWPSHGMLMARSVGLLYLWSAEAIKKGQPNGIEGALGMSLSISPCHIPTTVAQ